MSRVLLCATASVLQMRPVVPASLFTKCQGTTLPSSGAWLVAASLGTHNKAGVTGTWLQLIPHQSPSPSEVPMCWAPARPEAVVKRCLCRWETGQLRAQARGSAGTHSSGKHPNPVVHILCPGASLQHSQPPFSREGSSLSPPSSVPGLKPNPCPASPCSADSGGSPRSWGGEEYFC